MTINLGGGSAPSSPEANTPPDQGAATSTGVRPTTSNLPRLSSPTSSSSLPPRAALPTKSPEPTPKTLSLQLDGGGTLRLSMPPQRGETPALIDKVLDATYREHVRELDADEKDPADAQSHVIGFDTWSNPSRRALFDPDLRVALSGAAGTEGAMPCLVALVKAVVNDDGAPRTFLGSVHVSNEDSSEKPDDVIRSHKVFYKRLDDALSRICSAPTTSKQYYLIGGSTDSLESATSLAHAAQLLNLDVQACILPSNRSNQSTDAMLTRDGLFWTKAKTDAELKPVPAGLHWVDTD